MSQEAYSTYTPLTMDLLKSSLRDFEIFTHWLGSQAKTAMQRLSVLNGILATINENQWECAQYTTPRQLERFVIQCVQLVNEDLARVAKENYPKDSGAIITTFLHQANLLLKQIIPLDKVVSDTARETVSVHLQTLSNHIKRLLSIDKASFTLDPQVLLSFFETLIKHNFLSSVSLDNILINVSLSGYHESFKTKTINISWLENYLTHIPLTPWEAAQYITTLTNLAQNDCLEQPLKAKTINALLRVLQKKNKENFFNIAANSEALHYLNILAIHSKSDAKKKLLHPIRDLDVPLLEHLLSLPADAKASCANRASMATHIATICKTINEEAKEPKKIKLSVLKESLAQMSALDDTPQRQESLAQLLLAISQILRFCNPVSDRELLRPLFRSMISQLDDPRLATALSIPAISRALESLLIMGIKDPDLTRNLVKAFYTALAKEEKAPKLSSKTLEIACHRLGKYLCFTGQANTVLASLDETGLPVCLDKYVKRAPPPIKKNSHKPTLGVLAEKRFVRCEHERERRFVLWFRDYFIFYASEIFNIEGDGDNSHRQHQEEDREIDNYLLSLTKPATNPGDKPKPWITAIIRIRFTREDTAGTFAKKFREELIKIVDKKGNPRATHSAERKKNISSPQRIPSSSSPKAPSPPKASDIKEKIPPPIAITNKKGDSASISTISAPSLIEITLPRKNWPPLSPQTFFAGLHPWSFWDASAPKSVPIGPAKKELKPHDENLASLASQPNPIGPLSLLPPIIPLKRDEIIAMGPSSMAFMHGYPPTPAKKLEENPKDSPSSTLGDSKNITDAKKTDGLSPLPPAIKIYQEMPNSAGRAKYERGHCYEFGLGGVALDTKKARELYTEAAILGVAAAEFALGRLCEQGADTSADINRAITHYEVAAQRGLKQAKFKLLELSAAAKADSKTQYHLGKCYLEGDGVEKNELQGILQLLLSADKHYAPARLLLNQMTSKIYELAKDFLQGRGKVQNLVLGQQLYEIVKKYGEGFNALKPPHILDEMTTAILPIGARPSSPSGRGAIIKMAGGSPYMATDGKSQEMQTPKQPADNQEHLKLS